MRFKKQLERERKMLNKSTLESFAAPCPKQGKLELVHYTSRAYALEAIFGESPITMEKSMWVYTPYGYDPSKKYNVLFLMHGGTDNEGYWFGQGRYRGMMFRNTRITVISRQA